MQSLFQFVGLGIGLEVHCTAGVLWTLQDPRHRFRVPVIRFFRQRFSGTLGIMCLDGQDVFGGQQLGNLHRAFSRNAQVKNTLDDLGSSLVHNPLLFVRWVFHIPVGRISAEVFPSVSFGTHDGTDFLTGIAGVEVVEQVAERGKIVIPFVAVHTIIDGYISNITFHKETLGIVAHFQIVPAHAGHILDNNGLDFPRFCKAYHLIPTGSIE